MRGTSHAQGAEWQLLDSWWAISSVSGLVPSVQVNQLLVCVFSRIIVMIFHRLTFVGFLVGDSVGFLVGDTVGWLVGAFRSRESTVSLRLLKIM
jgi:hypothetical protein